MVPSHNAVFDIEGVELVTELTANADGGFDFYQFHSLGNGKAANDGKHLFLRAGAVKFWGGTLIKIDAGSLFFAGD